MLEVKRTAAFVRDVKSYKKKHYSLDMLHEVIDLIREDTAESRLSLVREYRDHGLKGQWAGTRECHVAKSGDWLIIYTVARTEGFVTLIAVGSHDSLF